MMKFVLITGVAAALAVFQASVLGALPFPADALELPLLLVVALVASFRFSEAIAAAIAAGAAADALSSMPFGVHIFSGAVVAVLLVGVFTRVVTNHSWPGTIGLNAAGFIMLNAALASFGTVRAILYGYPVRELFPMPESASTFALALGLQLAASIVAIIAGRRLVRAVSSIFFIR